MSGDTAERVNAETGPKPSRLRFLMTKTGLVISALVVALAGVAAPWLWNSVRDITRPPLLVSAEVDNTTVGDYSHAFAAVIPPERVAELGPVGDYPSGGPPALGAVKLEQLGTKITVEGASSRNVVITDMRARILAREPNLSGTIACIRAEGGGPTIRVGIDLDELDPTARVIEGRELGERYFADNAITLADGETVVFQVEVRAGKAHYTWVLELDVVIDGKAQTIEVRPRDGPYEITGRADRYRSAFSWAGGHGDFEPVPANQEGGGCAG
ncbi:hypothetical protein SAMN05216215_1001333 [Saccharopolyspora shandongensis]|uniref:Uncharacterized protein n=1 Tax=Saccharopolyspora shandongensis TaxID=418495 RepID=A0A1H2RAE7_9PSEU|nr:hypothetical protein [Saccharopolyspora shandongensis]SDW16255.1 hypothetical protein SAMN05216215_1001333 [Saccharopolyspora shandongensis]